MAPSSKRGLTLAALATLVTLAAAADTIHLKDGTVVQGSIENADSIKPADATIHVKTRYGQSDIPRAEIATIEWDPREPAPFDVTTFATAQALREAADLEYELGLQASQDARADELLTTFHAHTAIAHLTNARAAYTELAVQDTSKADFVERRVNEINSHIFWCSRFGSTVEDMGLDPSGRKVAADAKEEAANQAREDEAQKALDEAKKFQTANPQALDEVMQKYLDVVEHHPGTEAATDARDVITKVQGQMLEAFRKEKANPTGEPAPGAPAAPGPGTPAKPATTEDVRAELQAQLTRELVADGYKIRAHSSYEEELPQKIADQLHACAEVLLSLTGLDPEGDLEVLVLANQADFTRYGTGLAANDPATQRVLDLAGGIKKTIAVVGDKHQLVCYRSPTLFEDLRRSSVEQYLKAALKGQSPAFLAIGIGHYLQLAELDKKGTKVRGSGSDAAMQNDLKRATAPLGGGWGKRVRDAAGGGSLLAIEELITSPPDDVNTFEVEDLGKRVRQEMKVGGNRTQLYKAESWALVHWLVEGKGPAALVKKLCKELEKGSSIYDAHRATFARANADGKLDDTFEKFVKDFTD